MVIKRGKKGNPWDGWHSYIMADSSKSKQQKEEMCELVVAMNFNQWIPFTLDGTTPFWPNPMQIAGILAEEREVMLGGEAGCIAGETLLYNPATDRHVAIKDLYARGDAPIVRTLNGPIQAEVPFIKGTTDLYRVVLGSGRNVLVTMEHRFYTRHGWQTLSTVSVNDIVLVSPPRPGHVWDTLAAPAWDIVESITYERTDEYFDLHVPEEEHYLAEGIWHHNSGKTTTPLLKALCSITNENYMATFFRETERELLASGGMVWTLLSWLKGKDGWTWNQTMRTCTFNDTNASIDFGFLNEPGDEDRFLGFPRQMFNFEEYTRYKFRFDDEAGKGRWTPYQFLFRSQRKPPGMPIPLQTYATTNPGGIGEKQTMSYWLPPTALRVNLPESKSYMLYQPPRPSKHFGGRIYFHGVRAENEGIDQASYDVSAALADETTRRQQFGGEWGLVESGGVFKTERIRKLPFPPPTCLTRRTGIDKAATKGGRGARTAIVVESRIPRGLARHIYGGFMPPHIDLDALEFIIERVYAGRWSVDEREENIDTVAEGGDLHLDTGRDVPIIGVGRSVPIIHEQEPGSGGKQSAEITTRRLIGKGFQARHITATGTKEARAISAASAVAAYMVGIVESDGSDGQVPTKEVLAELKRFKNDAEVIDIGDALNIAHNDIVLTPPVNAPVATEERDPGTYVARGQMYQ